MKKIIRETAEEILQEYTSCYSKADEDSLVRMIEKLASNMAREIFEEIEKTAKDAIRFCGRYSVIPMVREAKVSCYKDLLGYIAELKKKYESEGADDENCV